MVVIRNIDHSTFLTDISDALADTRPRGWLHVKNNNRPLPLFHVEQALYENNQEILKIHILLYSAVVIEKRNSPPQYSSRGYYGHTCVPNYCSQHFRCVKYGEDHLTNNKCTKDNNSLYIQRHQHHTKTVYYTTTDRIHK